VVETFFQDEAGYVDWLRRHPRGFVINCEQKPSPNYLILHRSRCSTINGVPARGNRWTRLYGKVCATSVAELDRWARTDVGGKLQRCQLCDP
jgi:hypothetical protein